MVCRREQSKEMRKETSGALSPFLSSSSQVQTPPTLESEPGSNQRPHLALIRGLPLEVRERLYRNKGSVLWQTFPFQMAFVRQFSGVWLCAWHFGGKKKKHKDLRERICCHRLLMTNNCIHSQPWRGTCLRFKSPSTYVAPGSPSGTSP